MRKHLAVLASTTALLASTFALQPAHAAPDGSDLIINEVYARGGSDNQPYDTKFVELYNPTDAAVNLTGWRLGYSAASNTGIGNFCSLTGTIEAGGFYVVGTGQNNSGAVGEEVAVDQTCGLNIGGTNGAVTLLEGDAEIDLVGYGTAVRYETAAATYTGGTTTPGAISRTNAVDTDDNAADFTFVDVPTPGWDDSIDGSTEPTDPDPTDPPEDPDPTDPPVDPEPEYTAIADIQGTGDATPLSGQTVTTIGVVTAAYPTGGFRGAYLQTPGTGGEAKVLGDASDGIFVYGDFAAGATIGECYTVTGTAGEYNGLTQLTNPTLTLAEGCEDVAATELAALPQTDAEKEVYEGMLVLPVGTYTITNNYALNQYGQIGLAYGDEPLFQATDVVRPGDEAIAYEAANLLKEITLDDGSSWNYMSNNTAKNTPLPYLSAESPMRTGSQVSFAEPVILDYRFQWNYQPTSQVVGADQTFLNTENDRPATAPVVGGDVQLASFNVLNYFDDLGVKEEGCGYYEDMYGDPVGANNCQVRGAYSESAFADQEAKIVTAINKLDADVVGLQEIENSAGLSYLDQPRDKALATLVAALNEAGGNWAYVPSPTVVPTSEDVIRTAFIYNPDTVELVGPSYILVHDAFANARYPLAQEFKVTGTSTTFVAINNHFKSKGSGEDDGTGQGNANPSRVAQAAALSEWADTFEEFADKPVFLMGDFNAYSMEDPVRTIEAADYTNLTRGGLTDEATYQFSGRLGSLDHIFANEAALDMVTGAAVWNINGDESIAFQYSRRNYNIVDFHSTDEYASSDHDAVVVGIDAAEPVVGDTTPPVVEAIADVTVVAGEKVSIQVKATDDSALTYAISGHPELTISVTGLITGTPSKPGAATITVTVTDAEGNQSFETFKLTVKPVDVPPVDPPVGPPKFVRTAPYTLPGLHKDLNGRHWNTSCEVYSQTERCRTEIWATTVVIEDGRFVRKNAWVFNNLTYLPFMTQEAWGDNPLANAGRWTAETDGRQWMTECGTERTGRDGCRSYVYATVYKATPRASGGYTFSQYNDWVFNNIVMFGSPAMR